MHDFHDIRHLTKFLMKANLASRTFNVTYLNFAGIRRSPLSNLRQERLFVHGAV